MTLKDIKEKRSNLNVSSVKPTAKTAEEVKPGLTQGKGFVFDYTGAEKVRTPKVSIDAFKTKVRELKKRKVDLNRYAKKINSLSVTA